jgi:hypothetical protein
MRRLLRLAFVVLILGQPASQVLAQGPEPPAPPVWLDRATGHYSLVYAEGSEADADYYAAFADELYAWEARLFATDIEKPITLRLYPTLESYFQANPLAAQIAGVVAHANAGRREIAIALPRVAALGDEDRRNNVRHELAHLFLSALSDDQMPTGFHEGIAQYLEKPTSELEAGVQLLRQADQQGRLLDWSTLNERDRAYSDPQVAYPQSRSVVAFLVDRYGFARLLDFARAFRGAPGFRTALEQAYGVPADQLEAEWAAYLPEYLDGRWKINALYDYDLSRAEQLVTTGAYTPAEQELAAAIALLETTDQDEALARAQALLARARQGQAAHALADAARDALETGDYALAGDLVSQARDAFAALDDTARNAELAAYGARLQAVARARGRLANAEARSGGVLALSARDAALALAAELAALGDEAGARQAAGLAARIDARLQDSGTGLLVVAIVLLLANAGRRWMVRRRTAQDLEARLL